MRRCRSYCFCQCLSASLKCINASCCCAECENEVRADNNHESLILNNSICIQLNYSVYKERNVTKNIEGYPCKVSILEIYLVHLIVIHYLSSCIKSLHIHCVHRFYPSFSLTNRNSNWLYQQSCDYICPYCWPHSKIKVGCYKKNPKSSLFFSSCKICSSVSFQKWFTLCICALKNDSIQNLFGLREILLVLVCHDCWGAL